MPYRKIPIAVGETYHIFNRSIAKQPIFLAAKDYQRAVNVFSYYLHKPPLRFSFYNRLPPEQKTLFLTKLEKANNQLIHIISFCLMPNHVHFLATNITENGINQFMSNFQNSYAKYFNTRTGRTGSLFQPMFQAVRIETDEQLIHVSRYIHLNPVTAYLVKMESLVNYPWSSYSHYIAKAPGYIYKNVILDHFGSVKEYEKFVLDQVDYQRALDKIKHLTLE